MAVEPTSLAKKNQEFLRNPSSSDFMLAEAETARKNRARSTKSFVRPQALGMTDTPPEGVEETVMAQLRGWRQFSTLAIQVDPPVADKPAAALRETLDNLLASTLGEQHALWFHWRGPLYGCAVRDCSQEAAKALAMQIQAELAQTRIETVTIGISVFPLISFNRAQSLVNACKAIDHAAFFGPGSTVVFDAVSLNISGDQHYQAGDFGAAIAEYRAALRLDPANVNVLNSLGVCMAEINDLSAARESFQAALEVDPHEPMALYNSGLVCQLEGVPDQALEWFLQAYQLDGKTFDIPFQIGKHLVDQECWNKALPFLEKAAQIDATRSAAHTLLGDCYSGLRQTVKAITSYKKAVKLNPNDASALSSLGLLYDCKGENQEICLTFCRQSVHLSPGNGLYRKRLGDLYLKYDQPEQALDEYEKAAALGQDCCAAMETARRAMTQEASSPKQCCA